MYIILQLGMKGDRDCSDVNWTNVLNNELHIVQSHIKLKEGACKESVKLLHKTGECHERIGLHDRR